MFTQQLDRVGSEMAKHRVLIFRIKGGGETPRSNDVFDYSARVVGARAA
jgi:hypothetical protein